MPAVAYIRGLLLLYDCMVFADTLESIESISPRLFI